MPPISERGVEKAAAETLRPRPARSPNNQLRPAVRTLSSNQKSEDGFGPSVRPLYNESVLLKIAVFAAKISNWARQQSECHPDSGTSAIASASFRDRPSVPKHDCKSRSQRARRHPG